MNYHPILIGIANAVIPGAGYLILKERLVFGSLLIAATLLLIPVAFLEPASGLFIAQTPSGRLFEGLAYLLSTFAFGYDAYALAAEKRQAPAALAPASPGA